MADMTVRELIAALSALPESAKDKIVYAAYDCGYGRTGVAAVVESDSRTDGVLLLDELEALDG